MGRTLLLLILIAIVPRVANACGCHNTSSVLDDYEQADLVIIARMTAVTKGKSRFNSDISHATMTVEKVFKGDVKIGQELLFENGDPVLGCSWQFYEDYVGSAFLLYLYRPEKPSEPFVISTCNRSTGVSSAHEDLLYLENIDKLRGRTRVSGFVEREGADDNLEGQRLRIVGGKKVYIATTDKYGVYELYDLPPGRYTIEPVLETGWILDEYGLTRPPTRAELMSLDDDPPPPKKIPFTLRPKRHFGVSMSLRVNNRIAGRVTTPAGEPLNRVCISLVTVNTKPIVCNDFSELDGTFAIKSVDPGSYHLVINHENIRSSYQPFPTLYYPGVTDSAAAKVLTVKFAESIENLSFVVPALYDTVKLEGVVRYANERPASNADVDFKTKNAGADGWIRTKTDAHGRFSLRLLKGLRGELSGTYAPSDRELKNCPQLKKLLQGKRVLMFETERLKVEADENKTFELKLPASPCR